MKIERKRAGVMRKLTQNKMAASTKPRWEKARGKIHKNNRDEFKMSSQSHTTGTE
jgi:hypothetical protein